MVRRYFLFFTLLVSACTSPATASSRSGPTVLASTTVLADITQNVAGARIQVETLLPFGADPHSYQLTPQDVARISDSDLLIINGAGFEQFLKNALEATGGERTVVEASAGLTAATGGQAEKMEVDPHYWLDPNNVTIYAANIREGLSRIDPGGAEVYQANAEAYIEQLHALDAWINEQVSAIPVERRLLVTNHDSLGYFARRYGFTLIGTVVPGFSSDAAPSAQQMAALIDQIKSSGAPAVFLDAAESTTLADQIASDAGVSVVTDLHIGSLTDGAPAGTYVDMMKYNVTQMVKALK